jgi:hypothetical protein
MNDDRFGVLLVRKIGHMLDSTFGYRNSVRAQVNGIEKTKSLPIRAAEL